MNKSEIINIANEYAFSGKIHPVIDSLLPLYEKLHLPRCLTDMELYPLDDELLDKIAAFVDSKEKVHLIPLEINQQVLRSKIIELEKYILEK